LRDAFGNIPPPAPGGVDAEARRAPFTKQTASRLQPSSTWSPAVFAAIEWRRFEAVCEALFVQAGFETRSQSHGADGGVDIWLYSANAQGPVAVVQCKHWQGKAVGVKEIREFFGVMSSHQLKRGTYTTTSSYTADAQQFAKANGINAMDGPALLGLIGKRTPEQQQALLAVAFEGEYWRPTCASCGIKLVERQPSKGGAAFWGCSNYPRCKSRLPMVAALR
jgi:restriction system protein